MGVTVKIWPGEVTENDFLNYLLEVRLDLCNLSNGKC